MGPGMRKWVFKDHTAEEFNTTMAPAIDVVRKSDALDLPSVVDQYYNIDLSSKEAEAYRQMKEELVLEFGDTMILSQYQITKIQKLRQLACGFVFDQEHNDHWIVDKTSKDDALLELLDKLAGRSVVIWADFRPLYEHIYLLLGKKCGIIDKKFGNPDDVLRDFVSGRVKTIVANPASCGHGIDGWQDVASEAIYYTDNWSLEYKEQSAGRLDRMGQKNKVTNYHIVAKGTVDPLICQKVETKKQLSDLVLNHLRSE
jgi:SNF2 family DNA or RNA helicase